MRTIMPRSCDHLWPLYEQYLATMTRCEALGFSLTLDTSTMNLAYLLLITYPLVGQSGHNLWRKKTSQSPSRHRDRRPRKHAKLVPPLGDLEDVVDRDTPKCLVCSARGPVDLNYQNLRRAS
jgi:hypothetical protein